MYGEGAFEVVPRTFLLPEQYLEWQTWMRANKVCRWPQSQCYQVQGRYEGNAVRAHPALFNDEPLQLDEQMLPLSR